jgi:hypothetical protein
MNFTGVSDWVKGLGVALGAVAAAAGSYYLLNKKTAKEEDEYERKHESYSQEEVMSGGGRSEQRFHQASHEVNKSKATSQEYRGFLQNDSSIIVMTVDAAPGKCAGILRLPQHNKLYYYSVDWSQIFYFSNRPSEQESDKFELLNALIATLAFKHYIRAYQSSYRRILLQTDNSFANLKEGRQHKDPTNWKNFGRITTELNSLQILHNWKQVGIWEDADMWNANQLSRNSDKSPFRQPVYGEYRIKYDISDDVRNICVNISQDQE